MKTTGLKMIQVSNNEFLTAIFGEDVNWCHVTDFSYDPSNIPKDKHLIAWKGDYHCRYNLSELSNQYFTISTFYCDDEQQARRRKALYRRTAVIVLDDVKEKLSIGEVSKLPAPSYILETSQGSEQWGYILDMPCEDRSQVENLLDGLVANGLAPGGKDPGMKGVTRYVRLPEGCNSKSSKLVNGLPFKCQLTLWQPFNRVGIEQLAAPFNVNLNAVRRDARVDGAANVSDHPLINIPDIISVKEIRSDGRFDIICPWVEGHTDKDDSGAAAFTNSDGSIGFKCHHGSCQDRTGKDMLRHIESLSVGFSSKLKNWQIMREFQAVSEPNFMQQLQPTPVVTSDVTFMTPVVTSDVTFMTPVTEESFIIETVEVVSDDGMKTMCDALHREHPSSAKAREISSKLLKHAEDLTKLDQLPWHSQVIDIMGWSKAEFKIIIADLRKQWYGERVTNETFYDHLVFVKELNQFYDYESSIFFTVDAFQNSFSHLDAEARKIALQDGRVTKVDRLDYAPNQPRVFNENGRIYANTWSNQTQSTGSPGIIQKWWDHFDILGWGEYRKNIEQWMSFTLRYPETKINHMLLLGSGEGGGKDFLLYPLTRAMGDNYTVIDGEELLTGFHDHLLSTKYLHINEVEMGDRKEAKAISNKLKPLAAAPPDTLRVNQKNIKPISVRNILNASMTTNSVMPLRLNGPSRRFLALWSYINIRDEHDNYKPEWIEYWRLNWNWMKDEGGWQAVVNHLLHVVDLSDFNPAAAPPMTDFLRDIRDASKSGVQLTVEAFIEQRIGAFTCDLVSATDMAATLKNGAIFSNTNMHADGRSFTAQKVGMTMKEINKYPHVSAYHLGSRIRLWVLRDFEKYQSMSGDDLYKSYDVRMQIVQDEIIKQTQLRLVGNQN